MTGQHILAIQRPLAAEPAADVGRDDTNLMLGKSEGCSEVTARSVRRLSGKPYSEVTRRFRPYNDTSGLDRQRNLARAGDMHAANMLRLGKGLFHVAAFLCRDVANVAVQLFARQRRAGLESFLRVDYRGQRFVFYFDGTGSVLCESAAARYYGGDWHAGFMHGTAGQQWVRRYLLIRHHRRHRYVELLNILAGHNR